MYFVSDNPELKILIPRVPETAVLGNEDTTVKRVYLAPTIRGCLRSIYPLVSRTDKHGRDWIHPYYVYKTISEFETVYPTEEQVHDCKYTGEVWSLEPVKIQLVKKILIDNEINIGEGITEQGIEYGRLDYKYHEVDD